MRSFRDTPTREPSHVYWSMEKPCLAPPFSFLRSRRRGVFNLTGEVFWGLQLLLSGFAFLVFWLGPSEGRGREQFAIKAMTQTLIELDGGTIDGAA